METIEMGCEIVCALWKWLRWEIRCDIIGALWKWLRWELKITCEVLFLPLLLTVHSSPFFQARFKDVGRVHPPFPLRKNPP